MVMLYIYIYIYNTIKIYILSVLTMNILVQHPRPHQKGATVQTQPVTSLSDKVGIKLLNIATGIMGYLDVLGLPIWGL